MTIVKELNELAERMTGTNPKATTDAQAMNYIEQNYSGGSGGVGVVEIKFENEFLDRIDESTNKITNEQDIATLNSMKEAILQNKILRVDLPFSIGAEGYEHFIIYPISKKGISGNDVSFSLIVPMGSAILMVGILDNVGGWYAQIKTYTPSQN